MDDPAFEAARRRAEQLAAVFAKGEPRCAAATLSRRPPIGASRRICASATECASSAQLAGPKLSLDGNYLPTPGRRKRRARLNLACRVRRAARRNHRMAGREKHGAIVIDMDYIVGTDPVPDTIGEVRENIRRMGVTLASLGLAG